MWLIAITELNYFNYYRGQKSKIADKCDSARRADKLEYSDITVARWRRVNNTWSEYKRRQVGPIEIVSAGGGGRRCGGRINIARVVGRVLCSGGGNWGEKKRQFN